MVRLKYAFGLSVPYFSKYSVAIFATIVIPRIPEADFTERSFARSSGDGVITDGSASRGTLKPVNIRRYIK